MVQDNHNTQPAAIGKSDRFPDYTCLREYMATSTAASVINNERLGQTTRLLFFVFFCFFLVLVPAAYWLSPTPHAWTALPLWLQAAIATDATGFLAIYVYGAFSPRK